MVVNYFIHCFYSIIHSFYYLLDSGFQPHYNIKAQL